MPQFYTLLTDVGQAKIANAIALGGAIEITTLALGDGGGSLPTPDSTATALVNEVRRAPINTSHADPDNPAWIVVEQVLPPDIGGWTIREVGVYDADGDLIGIGNYPETYKPVLSEGSSRTQTVRFVMEVSDTSAVTLRVDPGVVLATRAHVDDSIEAHAQSRNHPNADTKNSGFTRYATIKESRAGNESKAAQTPAGGKVQIDDHRGQSGAHNAAQIDLESALSNFENANTVQAVLGMLKNGALLPVASPEQARALASSNALMTALNVAQAFGGGNQSMGRPGFQKLPGGLVLQWGSVSIAQSKREDVALPVPFPNGGFVAVANKGGQIGTNNIGEIGTELSRTHVIIVNNTEGSSLQGIRWLAIGF